MVSFGSEHLQDLPRINLSGFARRMDPSRSTRRLVVQLVGKIEVAAQVW